jgi:hypothetical protein
MGHFEYPSDACAPSVDEVKPPVYVPDEDEEQLVQTTMNFIHIRADEGKKPADRMFPEFAERRAKGLCATCGSEIGEFKDDLSRRGFGITGMCQKCQDQVFESFEEEECSHECDTCKEVDCVHNTKHEGCLRDCNDCSRNCE